MASSQHRPDPPLDRHARPHGHPPATGAALLPVLVWLNRLDLSTRFPTWQALSEAHVGKPTGDEHA